MAEKIKLAEFELDYEQIIKAAKEYKREIEALKKENAEIKKSEYGINEQYIKNEATLKELNKEYRLHIKTLEESKQQARDATTFEERLDLALDSEVSTIKDLREQNKILNKLRNETNFETEEGAEQIARLNAKLDENNAIIKKNVDSYAKQKINIGNYTESILDAYDALEKQKKELEQQEEALKKARNQTEKGSKEWNAYSTALVKVESDLEKVDKEMGAVNDEASDGVTILDVTGGSFLELGEKASKSGGAMQLFRGALITTKNALIAATKASLAFIATPIGAVLAVVAAAIGAVMVAFNRSEDSANKLKRAFAPLVKLFDLLVEAIAFVGDLLIDSFVKNLNAAADAVSWLTDKLADFMDFLGFEDAADGVREFKEQVDASSKAAQQLADDQARLVKLQREAGIVQLEYQTRAEKLRQLRDDESRSIEERVKSNRELGELLKEQADAELEIANLSLSVIQRRIEQEGASTELLDQQAEAKLKIAEINERINSQQSEQLSNLNSLRRENEAKAKEQQAQYQAHIKQVNELHVTQIQNNLDIFILEQGFRKRTLEEEYDLAKKVSAQKMAILKERLDRGLIEQGEYNKEVLELQNDLAEKSAEVAGKNALDELDAYKRAAEEKLQTNKYLNDAVAEAKTQLNNDLLEKELEYQETLLEQGLISQDEYDQQIYELKESNRLANEEIRKEREQKEREERRELEQLEYEEELQQMIERNASKFDIERAQIAEQQKQKQQDLDQALRDQLISEEVYAAKSKAITAEKERAEAKIRKEERTAAIDLTASVLDEVGKLVDESSAAGKAISIAKAIISTYQGIAASVAQGFPQMIPGIIAATATGFKAVKDIISTDIPKMSGGGSASTGGASPSGAAPQIPVPEYSDGFTGTRPDRPGLPTQGNSGVASENAGVAAGLNERSISAGIADAVREGAREGTSEGSSEGITNLSENRSIMKSGEF